MCYLEVFISFSGFSFLLSSAVLLSPLVIQETLNDPARAFDSDEGFDSTWTVDLKLSLIADDLQGKPRQSPCDFQLEDQRLARGIKNIQPELSEVRPRVPVLSDNASPY